MKKRGLVIWGVIFCLLLVPTVLAPTNSISVFDKLEEAKQVNQASSTDQSLNRKNPQFYPEGEYIAFMVSDLNWEDALAWNSATVWSKPDIEEPKDEHISLKPILSWDPKFHQFDLYPFGQEFTVEEPITIKTISIYYTEPAFFTNTVTIEIVEVGKEDNPIVWGSFEGKGNRGRLPPQWKSINLLKPYKQLKKGRYKLRAYTDGGDWPEWGFKHTGTIDLQGNPSADYEERGILYRLVGNQLIENVIQEHDKIDIGPCNELVFDNEKVYPEPVEVCAHPLAFYHEENNKVDAGIRRLTLVEGGNPSPKISGDNVVWKEEDLNYPNQESRIMHANLKKRTIKKLPTDNKNVFYPSVSKSKVLWESWDDNYDSTIVLYDLKKGQKEELNVVQGDLDYASIVGDFFVWELADDRGNQERTIHTLHLDSQKRDRIIFTGDVTVRGMDGKNNKLFWFEVENKDTRKAKLYMYDLHKRKKTLLLDDAKEWIGPNGVSEELIVKSGTIQNIPGIYVYYFKTQTTKKISNEITPVLAFDVDGNKIVWSSQGATEHAIYVFDPSQSKEKEVIQNTFDADASIYFLQQYQPDTLYAIGSLPDLLSGILVSQAPLGANLKGKITVLDPVKDYLKLWETYTSVVYVEHNYDLALVAASYASLINAPLIIEDSPLDTEETFRGKKVICVGNVDPKGAICSETYDLFALQKKYIEDTETNRFVMINPEDWHIKQIESYGPDKSLGYTISELYNKASLASIRLSGLKEQGLIITHGKTIEEIDQDVTQTIQSLRPDLTLTRLECSHSQTCASGFKDMTTRLKNYGNKITFSFKFPDKEIAIDNLNMLEFNFMVTDCVGKKDIEFYNNNKLLAVTSSECITDLGAQHLGSFFPVTKQQIKSSFGRSHSETKIESGDFTLKLIGPGKILVVDKYRGLIKDDVNVYYKSNTNTFGHFSCSDCIIDSKSDKKTSVEIKHLGTDLREVGFIFSDLDTSKDYFLDLELSGDIELDKLDSDGDVYINDQKIAGKGEFKRSLEIPKHLYTNPLKVRVTMMGLSGEIYKIDASLRTHFDEPTYLTIIASPNAIPISKRTNECDSPGYDNKAQEVDSRFYGDVDGNFLPDFITTRVFDSTIAGISAMIDRTAFIGLNKEHKMLAVVAGAGSHSSSSLMTEKFNSFWDPTMDKFMSEKWLYTGYKEVAGERSSISPLYDDASLIYYYDHGHEDRLDLLMSTDKLRAEKIYLNNPLIFTVACLTCSWDEAVGRSQTNELFCSQNVRRGALGMYFATDVSHWETPFKTLTNEIYLEGESVGQAVFDGKYEQYRSRGYNFCQYDQDPFYVWIGDGTLSIKDKGEVRG